MSGEFDLPFGKSESEESGKITFTKDNRFQETKEMNLAFHQFLSH